MEVNNGWMRETLLKKRRKERPRRHLKWSLDVRIIEQSKLLQVWSWPVFVCTCVHTPTLMFSIVLRLESMLSVGRWEFLASLSLKMIFSSSSRSLSLLNTNVLQVLCVQSFNTHVLKVLCSWFTTLALMLSRSSAPALELHPEQMQICPILFSSCL